MNYLNALMRPLLVLLILGLVVTAPAFAQSDNTCHADNPLHAVYPEECLTQDDWEIGWCRHKTYNEGWHAVEHFYTSSGEISDYYSVYADEYNGSMCQLMFGSAAFSYSDLPSWIRDLIDERASYSGRPISDFEWVLIRPDSRYNARAAEWHALGYGRWVNQKLLGLKEPGT